MSNDAAPQRHLVIYTHGEYASSGNEAAASAAIYFHDREYWYLDECKVLPAEFKKSLSPAYAGYTAIALGLSRAPWMADLTLRTEDELCITTLQLLMKEEDKAERVKLTTKHSHPKILANILADIASREEAGCTVELVFHQTCNDPNTLMDMLRGSQLDEWFGNLPAFGKVRVLAQRALKEATTAKEKDSAASTAAKEAGAESSKSTSPERLSPSSGVWSFGASSKSPAK